MKAPKTSDRRRRTPPRDRPVHVETSAGGVVYRSLGGAPRVLLIRDRNDHWGFPKGHLESGETAEEAAIREVREETGLRVETTAARLPTIDWYFRFRGRVVHKFCHFFLLYSESGGTRPQTEEGIITCRWLPVSRALERLSYDNARDVLRAAERRIRGGAEANDCR